MYFIVILNVLDCEKEDLVYSYSKEVITLGLLWMIMRIWKYLMLIFRQTNHRNYAKEAALLLINYHFATSERVATQLATSRVVNTKGRTGCNIPCDLHLEHLNRRLKGTICRMESNIKPSIIQTAAKAIGVVDEIWKSVFLYFIFVFIVTSLLILC